jgi:hypothetical protein
MSNHVSIQMCHNNPPTAITSEIGDHAVWCLQLWDNWNASVAIAEGCFKGNHNKAEKAVIRAYDRILNGYEKSTDLLTLSEGRQHDLDIFILRADDDAMKALANKWADDAIKELPDVGGDDSHYDYFPDFVNGLHQLCSQIQFPDPYNRFHDALYSTPSGYTDDPETPDLFPGRL